MLVWSCDKFCSYTECWFKQYLSECYRYVQHTMASGITTPQNTPQKIYKTVNVTPSSKESLCCSCGNNIENTSNRRKLRVGSNQVKSEACLTIERFREVPCPECTDIVCKFCLSSVTNTANKIFWTKLTASKLNIKVCDQQKCEHALKLNCNILYQQWPMLSAAIATRWLLIVA